MDKRIYRILVVDDEDDVREILARSLPRRLRVEVRTTGDGAQAVDLVRTYQPDLVLLDIHLPGHMGWDVLREVRHFDTGVKIIMLTGVLSVPPEDQEFILQQTSGYLTKPMNPDDIAGKIIEVLGGDVVL